MTAKKTAAKKTAPAAAPVPSPRPEAAATAPVPTTAPAPYLLPCHCGTPHHPSFWEQPGRLERTQLKLLLSAIGKNRVHRTQPTEPRERSLSYLEATDIKVHLLRIFGWGGFSTELVSNTMLLKPWVNDNNRMAIIYKAHIRLTIRDPHGRFVTSHDGTATGAKYAPQNASLDKAHHDAMNAAETNALVRAVHYLGDQFGLSLYNNGSLKPIVRGSLAHPDIRGRSLPVICGSGTLFPPVMRIGAPDNIEFVAFAPASENTDADNNGSGEVPYVPTPSGGVDTGWHEQEPADPEDEDEGIDALYPPQTGEPVHSANSHTL